MQDPGRPFANANVLLDRVVDICPFPATAQRLMVLVNDDQAPLESIAAAVQCDPALATQVLRVANSAAFRAPGSEPVRDLRQALVALGLGELRMMAGAMALLATFATRDELSLDLHHTSAISGAIAETIAMGQGASRSLPFICGLLCEVGALACLAVDGPGYVDLWQHVIGRRPGGFSADVVVRRDELETQRYGVTTRTIGARLLRRHQLPQEIAQAVEAAPDPAAESAPLTHRATAFARIATLLVVGPLSCRDSAALTSQVTEVARLTSLVEMPPPELARRCMLAATNMERTLRAARD